MTTEQAMREAIVSWCTSERVWIEALPIETLRAAAKLLGLEIDR